MTHHLLDPPQVLPRRDHQSGEGVPRLDHGPVFDPRPFEALRPGILPECLEVDRTGL